MTLSGRDRSSVALASVVLRPWLRRRRIRSPIPSRASRTMGTVTPTIMAVLSLSVSSRGQCVKNKKQKANTPRSVNFSMGEPHLCRRFLHTSRTTMTTKQSGVHGNAFEFHFIYSWIGFFCGFFFLSLSLTFYFKVRFLTMLCVSMVWQCKVKCMLVESLFGR